MFSKEWYGWSGSLLMDFGERDHEWNSEFELQGVGQWHSWSVCFWRLARLRPPLRRS